MRSNRVAILAVVAIISATSGSGRRPHGGPDGSLTSAYNRRFLEFLTREMARVADRSSLFLCSC
jgi:hypothetical protein